MSDTFRICGSSGGVDYFEADEYEHSHHPDGALFVGKDGDLVFRFSGGPTVTLYTDEAESRIERLRRHLQRKRIRPT